MNNSRFVVLSLLVLLMLMASVSCGGGTAGYTVSELSPAVNDFMGISAGDFKAVRFNDAGYRDSALNATLDLQSVREGGVTTVTVAINDMDPMYGVAMELLYDATKYSPEQVEFSGLVGTPVELASTAKAGIVALGQADLKGVALRTGTFAVVTFRDGAARSVSAAGDSHTVLVNRTYDPSQLTVITAAEGFALTKATAESGNPASYNIFNTFMVGDADDNGESNIGDLTPMVSYGYFTEVISDTDLGCAVTDFDGNGETNIADLTPLGQHLQEVTTGIEILLGDDGTFEGTDAALETLDWSSGAGGIRPPATTTDWNDIWRQWGGTVTIEQCTAADTNADGIVFVSARTANGNGTADAFPGLEITFDAAPENTTVTGIDLEIQGATGGSGTGGLFVDGDVASVVASSELTITVTGISGTYNAVPFTAADSGTVPTYADALDFVTTNIAYSASNAGAADMRMTSDVLVLSGTTGPSITATVFPDDDPESDNTTPEGAFTASVPVSGTFIPAAININVGVDVTADLLAPVINEMSSGAGQDGDDYLLYQAQDTLLLLTFDFGTGGAPADLKTINGELYDFDAQSAIPFTNVTTDLSSNEFSIALNIDPGMAGTHMATVIVGGGVVVPGHTYSFRLDVPPFNSVNKPGFWLVTAPPPTPVDFEYLPVEPIGPDNDFLWLFYPDPMLRRTPYTFYNLPTQSWTPDDPDGFADVIKQSGSEFPMNYIDGVLLPRIIILEDPSPSSIGPTTVGVEGVTIPYSSPDKMQIFIGTCTSGGGIGDPDVVYSFKVFGAFDMVLGQGTFTYTPGTVPDPAAPQGVDFGVNIFDDAGRGDLLLGDRDYSNKLVDGGEIGLTTPPVVFFELSGGHTGKDDQVSTTIDNIAFRMSGGSGDMDWDFNPVIIGLDATGTLICAHLVVAADFVNPAMPGGGPGRFSPGNSYDVILDDPAFPGEDFTYPDQLTVVGTNPNL